MPDEIQSSYERARFHTGEGAWLRLTAHEQTVAVYQELRALDAEAAAMRCQPAGAPAQSISSATNGQATVRLRLVGQMEAWTVTGENVLPTGRKTRALLAAI